MCVGITYRRRVKSQIFKSVKQVISNTGNTMHSAIQLLHAINLSEDNTLARLQTVGSVVHAGHHPRVALQSQVEHGEKRCLIIFLPKKK